jgi:hypothetical protein
VAYWLHYKQQRTPGRGTRRARNWRKIVFGERIVNKYGEVTDWEAVSPPYRQGAWDVLGRIDVRCLACGEFYDRYLNDIIQGKSRRCRHCRSARRKAPVPPQNPVEGTIVDVCALGVKRAYPDAALAVRPARDRQIEAPGCRT